MMAANWLGLLKGPFAPGRRLASAIILALSAVVAGFATLGYIALTLPVSRSLVLEADRPSLLLEAADGRVFASRGTIRSKPVAVDGLPPDLIHAVLAIEDRRFYSHAGLDLRGIARALWVNLRAGDVRQGGSTITQQLAKVMFLPADRTLKRKLQELMIALWLERHLAKDEILARYLGSVYFGAGAYGVTGAARRYFDKPVRDLALSEAALLAGLIRAPSALTPVKDPAAARARAALVLQAMVDAGSLDATRAAAARARPARLAVSPDRGSGHNYFADWVSRRAQDLIGPIPAHFTLRSTLNLELQDLAERVVAAHLEQRGAAGNVGQAALVALAPDGAVLAMVGGRDYGASQFNRATQARRQPGSLFKLFVYLAALEAGFDPDSMIDDRPVTIDDWQPRNYDGEYRGPVTLREAFARSINTVTVRLSEAVGRDTVVETARRLGVTSAITSGPSLALGTSEATLLEMTAAYGALAAGAARLDPYGIRSIEGGGRGLGWLPPTLRKLEPASSWARDRMLGLLVTAVQSGTGRAARLTRPVAGKTGTSQDHRDAWFVGFTSDLVVGVWVGNDDNAPMKGVTGGTLPAGIWRDFAAGAEGLVETSAGVAALDAFDLSAVPIPAHRPAPREAETRVTEAAPGATAALPALSGVPRVLDTGSLAFGPEIAKLTGVRGEKGRFMRELQHYIGGRPVTCRPHDADSYSCEVDGYDLSEVVLFNGGGRSSPGAAPSLIAAERHARKQRLGIWAR